MLTVTRRLFVSGSAAAAIAGKRPALTLAEKLKSFFKLAVINDEISQDFDHVCHVVSHEFGLEWIELRPPNEIIGNNSPGPRWLMYILFSIVSSPFLAAMGLLLRWCCATDFGILVWPSRGS